jgi:universal stress protein A
MFRKLLVATDFSPASRPAVARATELAKERRAELLIAHVLPSVGPIGTEGWIPPRIYDEMAQAVRETGQKRLDRAVEQARRAGVRARGLLFWGIPHEVIARLARREKADLVVVGTHGRTGLSRLMMGSVASRVVGTAPCPVLTVRAR